jgi:putative ABC transport system ATP-binding protein
MLETPLSDEKMVQRAEDLLKSLNMENKLDQIPTKLSGGERQRVAIARALANHPSLILADEPTGSLDSKTGKIILDILRDIHRRDGVTIVMVTHDERVAEAADRIIQVSAGRIEV